MILEARHLTKRFRRGQPALDDVSFGVAEGEVFGLLGHNGAGKSTALGIMLGLVYPDSGEVIVDGASVQRQRPVAMRKVGAIFEAPAFYDYLSGWRNLSILAGYSGAWEKRAASEVVALVGLDGRIGDPVGSYSHGMRQRLALAQALLPEPKILLLDEPTDGLDPEGIKEFRELVLRLRDERGITVLLNSHLLSEVEQMCTRFGILRMGKLVYDGDGTDIGTSDQHWRVVAAPGAEALLNGLGAARVRDDIFHFPDGLASAAVVEHLVHRGVAVSEITPVRRSLEEVYLAVSSGAAAGGGAGAGGGSCR